MTSYLCLAAQETGQSQQAVSAQKVVKANVDRDVHPSWPSRRTCSPYVHVLAGAKKQGKTTKNNQCRQAAVPRGAAYPVGLGVDWKQQRSVLGSCTCM